MQCPMFGAAATRRTRARAPVRPPWNAQRAVPEQLCLMHQGLCSPPRSRVNAGWIPGVDAPGSPQCCFQARASATPAASSRALLRPPLVRLPCSMRASFLRRQGHLYVALHRVKQASTKNAAHNSQSASHPVGYDCSGLTRWAYYKAFGDVNNGATGTQVRYSDLQPPSVSIVVKWHCASV